MRVAHMFAGAGGGILADLILGHKPVLAVEIERDCCNILEEHKSEGWLNEKLHIHCGDIREFDWEPWAGRVDQLAAGFPCQDISCAGSGKGISGPKSGLIWEVFRAIDVVRPKYVFLENSPNIRTKGRREIIAALLERGYSRRDGKLSAFDIGAPHIRDRWWLLAANAEGKRLLADLNSLGNDRRANSSGRDLSDRTDFRRQKSTSGAETGIKDASDTVRSSCQAGSRQPERTWDGQRHESTDSTENAADADDLRRNGWSRHKPEAKRRLESENSLEDSAASLRDRLERTIQQGGLRPAEADSIQAAARYTGAYHWSPPDVGLCGVVDGISDFMVGNKKTARIKALGNAQVPLCAAAAWMILSGQCELKA